MVGLGVLDAFTAGLPLVTTDCRIHSPEIAYLRSGENGLMTANSVEAFAQAVVGLLENEPERRRLGANAQSASSQYTIENMAQRFRAGIHGALQICVVICSLAFLASVGTPFISSLPLPGSQPLPGTVQQLATAE